MNICKKCMSQNLGSLKCTVSNEMGSMLKELIVAYDFAISLEGQCKITEVGHSNIPTSLKDKPLLLSFAPLG